MTVTLQSDHDAFMELSKNVATMYMNRSQNNFVKYEGNDFINTVGFAMHLRPDESKLAEGAPGDAVFFSSKVVESMNHIVDAVRDYGGNDPYMIIYPVTLQVDDTKGLYDEVVCLPIFRVRSKNDQTTSRYIDTNGRSYSDENDFKNNAQLPPGKMSYPKALVFSPDKDGNAEVVYAQVNTSTTMEYVDLTVTLLCLGAGALAIFTGVGIPFAVGIAVACGTYGVTRSTQTLVDRAKHGQSINPFADWDSFNAWAGIAANVVGFGFAASSIRLSGQISRLAAEGLTISRSTQLALKASIYIPYAINGGLMAVQFYQLAAFWDRLAVQQKIVIGLQFLFFAATAVKMRVLSVKGIEERAGSVAYNELRDHLAKNVDDRLISRGLVSYMDQAAERIGGRNYRTINFLKKLVNYHRGSLIMDSMLDNSSEVVALTKKGDEIGFKVRKKYFCGPEATIEVNKEFEIQDDIPSTSFYEDTRLPMTVGTDESLLDSILAVKRFVDIEKVENGQKWLKNFLEVDKLENYRVNNVAIFENMQYHDQVRLLIFEDIGKGLNKNLIKTCLKYASEQDVKSVGQYASEYEIASLQIHKQANGLIETFKKMTPAKVKDKFNIDLTITKETRMAYADLPKEKPNYLFADEPAQKMLPNLRRGAINSMGIEDAEQVFGNWKSSIEIPQAKTIASPDADLVILANEVIDAGDLSFQQSEFQAINAASFLRKYGVIDINQFPKIFADDANATIQSCRGSAGARVFEITREKDVSLGMRRLVFWSLEDDENAKSVVVAINKNSKEVRIQNFNLKKSKTTSTGTRNPKEAIFEHWENNYDYENLKTTLRDLVDTIKTQCEEYVGPQLVRAGLDHAETVSDIQSLSSVRFASVEHAICHVLKHGEYLTTNEQLVTEVKNYFNKAQKIIKSTIGHPENVSSSWTQTGSARDFFFHRKLLTGRGVEKVVVLVREGGEVIMKTYFLDERMTDIPTQKEHSFQRPVDIKHADLRTFYFQMMLMAPRYGVLLPKDYELLESELDKEKTRILLIMAGHYFNNDGTVNTDDLSKAINSAFPLNGVLWNIVAMNEDSEYSYEGFHQVPNYMYARIKNFRFVIFAELGGPDDDPVLQPGAKEKYGSIPNKATVLHAEGFDDSVVLDIACRICSHSKETTDIVIAMNESFGGQWCCFRARNYLYTVFYSCGFLKVSIGDVDVMVFR